MTLYPTEQAPVLDLFTLDADDGETKVNLSQVAKDHDFTLVVFYRGVFCPVCKMQLRDIEEHYQQLSDANMKVIAVSMDTKENATIFAKNVAASVVGNTEDKEEAQKLQTTIAYGMTEKQAREWGLYISKGREGTAEPAVFSEPGVFVVKPDNSVFMAMTQSAPFARPSTEQLIGGLQFAKAHNYPARGTLTAMTPEV